MVSIVSERFCDVGSGITLCYETFGDPGDPPLLLVMGLGMQMVAWHDDFCAQLAARGFHVVRFDNRDSGRSTHMPGRQPSLARLLLRRFGPEQYRVADMAADAAGLLCELGLAPAHVVGASMGGMIAQALAIEHPGSVRSLVSIMSNTGSRWSGQPALRTYPVLLRPTPGERDAVIERGVELFRVIGSTGVPQDVADVRAIAARSYDRDPHGIGSGRQLAAILASPDRTPALRRLALPALVVHGTADPLVAPSGGRATARAIPGARLLEIPGMGHDLPRAIWPVLLDAIAEVAARADAARAHPS